MPVLPLTYAPHPIFKQKAEVVTKVDGEIQAIIRDMLDTMYFEKAVGIGANMVGVLKRIVVVDLQESGQRQPYVMVNPEITWRSEEKQSFLEGSICFPFIDAEITRPKAIRLNYLDYDGKPQALEAEGFLATVIQHEADYLEGRVFLDYLSKMKRDMLLKKMEKQMKLHPPHVHGEHCHH